MIKDKQQNYLEELIKIGQALSAEHNISKLLDMILTKSMEFTSADGGSLYLLDENEEELNFKIIINKSLGTHLGGTSNLEVDWPAVPLYSGGEPNYHNVSAYSVLKNKVVNINDVYSIEEFDFSGSKEFDQQNNYYSKAMLVIPLRHYDDSIIGVIQLINPMDEKSGEIKTFTDQDEEIIQALASQAAVSISNTKLISELRELLDSIIKMNASAIDKKSKFTGNHIARVASLTMIFARRLNRVNHGEFAEFEFSDEQLDELKVAAWMHDVGKIITPNYIINKSRKLEKPFDRLEYVKLKFELYKRKLIINTLKKDQDLDEDIEEKVSRIDSDLEFLSSLNQNKVYPDEEILDKLENMASREIKLDGQKVDVLTREEKKSLASKFGTLTPEEREVIEEHAKDTMNLLQHISYPEWLKQVPEIASGHHEKLDGSGYPRGLTGDQLMTQTKILAISDIFEALTAPDRKYRDAGLKFSKVIEIMNDMVEKNHIDGDLFQVFMEEKIYEDFFEKWDDDRVLD